MPRGTWVTISLHFFLQYISAAVIGFLEARESGGVTCVFESIVSDSTLLAIRGTDAKKLVIDNQRESIHFPPNIYYTCISYNIFGKNTTREFCWAKNSLFLKPWTHANILTAFFRRQKSSNSFIHKSNCGPCILKWDWMVSCQGNGLPLFHSSLPISTPKLSY